MQTTDTLIDLFLADADRFGAVVAVGGDWSGGSPCDGWTATDVLDHVIATERDFLARHGVDTGASPTGGADARWATHRVLLGQRLTAELVATPFDGYFGPTTIGATWHDFYAFDLLVHRWDLGTALGQEVTYGDDELARLEARVPEPGTPIHAAFYSEGNFRPALPTPPGADRQTRLLAAFGRAPDDR